MEDLKKIVEENLKLTQEIAKKVNSIKRYILWQQIWAVVKIILIVVPLIFALIYALPFLQQAMASYQGLMGELGQTKDLGKSLNLDSGTQKLLEQYLR